MKPYVKFYFSKWARIKRAKPEDTICLEICNHLRRTVINDKFNGLFFHVENEGNGGRSHQLNSLKKASGKIAGVADYVFCREGLTIFIEIKTKKGTQQKSQEHFETWCNDYGVPYYIARSWDETEQILIDNGFIEENKNE